MLASENEDIIAICIVPCVWCGARFCTKYTAFFGDFRWPGKLHEPKAVGEELASPSYSPPVNSAPPELLESIRLVPNKDSLSETAGQASQSSSTVGSELDQHANSGINIFAEFSYEYLTEFSPECSISQRLEPCAGKLACTVLRRLRLVSA